MSLLSAISTDWRAGVYDDYRNIQEGLLLQKEVDSNRCSSSDEYHLYDTGRELFYVWKPRVKSSIQLSAIQKVVFKS